MLDLVDHRRHGRRRHRARRGVAATSASSDGKVVAIEPATRAGQRPRRRRIDADRPRSWRPASSTSTPTTTPRSCGTACSPVSPWHGVTTVVTGNCGFGVAPDPARAPRPHRAHAREGRGHERRRAAGRARRASGRSRPSPSTSTRSRPAAPAINVAALIGHTPVRLDVMGEDATERAATADEVARMRAIVAEAIEAGAVGLRHVEVAHPRRLRGPPGAEPGRRASPRSSPSPARSATPAAA